MKPDRVRYNFSSMVDLANLDPYSKLGKSIGGMFKHFGDKEDKKRKKEEELRAKEEARKQQQKEQIKNSRINKNANKVNAPLTYAKIQKNFKADEADELLSKLKFSDPKPQTQAKTPKIKSLVKGGDGYFYHLYNNGILKKSEVKHKVEDESLKQRIYIKSPEFKTLTPQERANMDIFADEKGRRYTIRPTKINKKIGDKEL